MKKTFFLAFIALLCFSCEKKEEQKNEETPNEPVSIISFEQPAAFAPGKTQTIEYSINSEEAATVSISNLPEGWIVSLDETAKKITVTAPVFADATPFDKEAQITIIIGDKTETTVLKLSKNTSAKYYDTGVVIGSKKWATRNVDKPGTFADKPEDKGMYYQWNNPVGWSSTDPMISTNGTNTWDSEWNGGYENVNSSSVWTTTNDVCPAGWRVPTRADILELARTVSGTNDKWTKVNGVSGTIFGSGNNTVFLPAAGRRSYEDGKIIFPTPESGVSPVGNYWASTTPGYGDANYLFFLNGSCHGDSYTKYANACSVRCVAVE